MWPIPALRSTSITLSLMSGSTDSLKRVMSASTQQGKLEEHIPQSIAWIISASKMWKFKWKREHFGLMLSSTPWMVSKWVVFSLQRSKKRHYNSAITSKMTNSTTT
jgi:hypothetical protein